MRRSERGGPSGRPIPSITGAVVAVASLLWSATTGCSGPDVRATEVAPIVRAELEGQSSELLRLAVVGDKGELNVPLATSLAALHDERPIDAILLLGDNFYECGVRGLVGGAWYRFVDDLGTLPVPTYAVLGNHDYGVGAWTPGINFRCPNTVVEAQIDATGRIAGWNMPRRNYVLEHPVAEIVMVDTSPIAYGWEKPYRGSATSGETLDWLGRVVEQRPGPAWRFVAGHHPVVSSGPHVQGNDPRDRTVLGNLASLRSLLEAAAVDLHLAGHDHHLELAVEPGRPPAYLVSGAGSRLRDLLPRSDDGPPTVYPEFPSEPYRGFALIEATPDRLEILFFDEHGVDRGGPYAIGAQGRDARGVPPVP